MALEPTRKRAVYGGAAALLLLLALYLTLSRPAPPPMPAAPPAAAPEALPAAPPPEIASAPPPEGLRLHGVTGSGAIFALPDGRQRLVAIGGRVSPGVTLRSVAADHAVLEAGSAEYRLDFVRIAAAASAAAPPRPAAEAAIRDETLHYRLGLTPQRIGGRVAAHVVKAGASLPALEQAGLRAGDIIRRVNGSEFDEERMLELAWTLANSDRVEFEIERRGRPMTLVMPGGRPQ